jgi:hypothetical protein
VHVQEHVLRDVFDFLGRHQTVDESGYALTMGEEQRTKGGPVARLGTFDQALVVTHRMPRPAALHGANPE